MRTNSGGYVLMNNNAVDCEPLLLNYIFNTERHWILLKKIAQLLLVHAIEPSRSNPVVVFVRPVLPLYIIFP